MGGVMHSACHQVEEATVLNPDHLFHTHPHIFLPTIKRKSIRSKAIASSRLLRAATRRIELFWKKSHPTFLYKNINDGMSLRDRRCPLKRLLLCLCLALFAGSMVVPSAVFGYAAPDANGMPVGEGIPCPLLPTSVTNCFGISFNLRSHIAEWWDYTDTRFISVTKTYGAGLCPGGYCSSNGYEPNYPTFYLMLSCTGEYPYQSGTWVIYYFSNITDAGTYNPATNDWDGDGTPDIADANPDTPPSQVVKGVEKDKTAYGDHTCDTQGDCSDGSQPTGMPGLVVNLSSLNFVLQDKDIAYNDIGRTIEVNRFYNAYSTYQGIFGRGWTFNYGVHLVADASGNITVMRGSGAEKLFTRKTDGTYTPPKGVYDKLTKNPDGTFSLWEKDEKMTYSFASVEATCPFVSYWEFNEGNGTTAVDSVGGHNGTIQGASWTTGKAGGALSFDGVDDYVNGGNAAALSLTSFTISAWFQWHSEHPSDVYRVIVSKGRTGEGYEQNYMIYVDDASHTVRARIGHGSGSTPLQTYFSSGVDVSDGDWHHVALVYDSATGAGDIYVDGLSKNPKTGLPTAYTDANAAVTIGIWGGPTYGEWDGLIDEVAVCNRALSPEEIQQQYQNGLAGHGYLGEGSGYACNGSAVLSSITDTNNNTVTLAYDGIGHLASITDVAGRSTTFAYNSDNQVSTITDPLGRLIHFTYENGNMRTSTDLAEVTTTFTYDATNFLTSMSTPLGATSFAYQDYPFGRRLASVTNPAGLTTLYAIDAPNSEVIVTDPRGNQTHYGYNYDGYTTYVTDALGNKTAYAYDAAGNRISVTDANNKQTTIVYDSRGNITTITDPLTKIANFTYDTRDNLTQTKDPLNRIYAYTYDTHDNLTRITDPLTHQTNFAYDAKGELVSLTDARGKTASFAYDQYGNLTTITDPLSHTASFTYNLIGKQQTATDPLGHTSNFEYDPLGRLVRRIHADSAQFIIERYCSGISGIIDENGKHTVYDHNAINMLTKVHDPMGYQTSYTYDNAGNLTQLTDPLNQATTYAYDIADRLIQQSYPEGASESYTYDPTGNLISKTDANGITISYAYDDVNRLVSLTAPDLAISYTYDAVGNLLSMMDATGTTSYTYDSLNRLTNVKSGVRS